MSYDDTFIVGRLYKATVRATPNVLVSPRPHKDNWWASLTPILGAYLHSGREVSHVRGPLFVLDPASVGGHMENVIEALIGLGFNDLAQQLVDQRVEPDRIREPVWGNSVMASSVYSDMREPWIRWTEDPSEPHQWRNRGGKVTSWAELHRPEMGGSGRTSND